MKLLDYAALVALAHATSATPDCCCRRQDLAGWAALSVTFPENQLEVVGTLVDPEQDEPTIVEYHTAGTHYWSPDAPIAPRYFPYNRCTVSRCRRCAACFLSYTEFGGYYVERRVRALQAALLIDAHP